MISKTRLNQNVVDRIPAPSRLVYQKGKRKDQPMPEICWDTGLLGFGVLVTAASKIKNYIVRVSVKGMVKRPRIKIGSTEAFSFEEARDLAADYIAMGRKGIDPRDQFKIKKVAGTTLREALQDHVDDCRAKGEMAEASITKLETNINRFLPTWLDTPLVSITRDMVVKRHREIPKEIAAGERKGYSGTTQANQVMRAFRRVFNMAAAKDGKLARNPVEVLTATDGWYREPPREDHVPAHLMDKFWNALDALPNQVQADLIKLMLLTGLREGNARALHWSQVDFQGRLIRIESGLMKSRRTHELPMSDYLQILLEKRAALGRVGWVFPANSKSGHVAEPRKAVKACGAAAGIVEEAGLPELTIHGLRRTFSTHAFEVIPFDKVSLLLGHANRLGVTKQYIRSTVNHLREPMQMATDHILTLAGVNITDPDKIPKDFAALEAAYIRRFGAVTFDAVKVGKANAEALMREALLNKCAITDVELQRRSNKHAA